MNVVDHFPDANVGVEGAGFTAAEVASDVAGFEEFKAPAKMAADVFVCGDLLCCLTFWMIAAAVEVDLGFVDAMSDHDASVRTILH